MDVMIFAVVLLLLAAFVAAPLYRQTPGRSDAPSADPAAESARAALSELEVDRESGLIDETSYRRERDALEARLGD